MHVRCLLLLRRRQGRVQRRASVQVRQRCNVNEVSLQQGHSAATRAAARARGEAGARARLQREPQHCPESGITSARRSGCTSAAEPKAAAPCGAAAREAAAHRLRREATRREGPPSTVRGARGRMQQRRARRRAWPAAAALTRGSFGRRQFTGNHYRSTESCDSRSFCRLFLSGWTPVPAILSHIVDTWSSY